MVISLGLHKLSSKPLSVVRESFHWLWRGDALFRAGGHFPSKSLLKKEEEVEETKKMEKKKKVIRALDFEECCGFMTCAE